DYFCEDGEKNRSEHFVDDRLRARDSDLGDDYSISLWFWNGMPNDRRAETGWLFSRDFDYALGNHGDHLGISGTTSPLPGRLMFFHGADSTVSVYGKAEIPRWTWTHLVFTRKGEFITVHLNGKLDLETEAPADFPEQLDRLFFGGRSDNANNFEGRLDEIAVFDRALNAKEIEALTVK
ncbi:MAG: LamG domain-containing protein, partial [Verrucomicrobiales bacterium]|nr:LamG domain-containing protein [Verrucomicrobiales bacterium]